MNIKLTAIIFGAVLSSGLAHAQQLAPSKPIFGTPIAVHRGVDCYAFTMDGNTYFGLDRDARGVTGQQMGIERVLNTGNISILPLPRMLPCNDEIFATKQVQAAGAIDSPQLLPRN